MPMDVCLTFTPHFRLRRSPHRGRVMRKRPLDSPPPHIVVLSRSRPPHIGLAGACRYLTFPLLVGAPLPCTASRRGRYYPFLCSCAFVWLKRMWRTSGKATRRKKHLSHQHQSTVLPSPSGRRTASKGEDAATLQRVSSAASGNSKKPSATGAAPGAAASPTCPGEQGGPGGSVSFRFPPAALRRFRRAKAASELQYIAVPKIR